jgi:hypothetical protein
MDQGVEEIQAERDGDDQSDDRLTHGAPPLKLAQGVGIDAHQRQKRTSKNQKRNIEHNTPSRSHVPTAESHKLSMPNRGALHKDSIRADTSQAACRAPVPIVAHAPMREAELRASDPDQICSIKFAPIIS